MKIALIGYGAMGKIIETLAKEKGHSIAVVIADNDRDSSIDEIAAKLTGSDAAIDFSAADAVPRNAEAALAARVPLIEGTTGWNAEREAIEQSVLNGDGSFIYGANFSIGVNLFYRIAGYAAELFAQFPDYEVFVEEQHHSRKKDAPSGTAMQLKAIVEEHFSQGFSVSSTRAGRIPGTHRVGFDGPADQILLEHAARSREGFAAGAVMAAEWIVGKKGFYEFTQVIDEILASDRDRPRI